MRRNLLLAFCGVLSATFIQAQESKQKKEKEPLIPYIGFSAGGCGVSNPFAFMAGVQQPLKEHISIAYDVNFWKTNYEVYCCDTYSKGKYSSVTPSVKLFYNTGKGTGRGFTAGIGLGYMFVKDRGIETTYTVNQMTGETELGKDFIDGKWDFNSIATSITFGAGFRVAKLPVTFTNTYYFAKSTEGWGAVEGGAGFKVGLKKLHDKKSKGKCSGKSKCMSRCRRG